MRSSTKNRNATFPEKVDKSASGNHTRAAQYAISNEAPLRRFGEELYSLRKIAGLKQADVARLTGLTRGYYSQLENSKRWPPPPVTVDRISAALHLSTTQSKNLRHLADAERCTMVGLPEELPVELANLFRQLAAKAYSLSPEQLRQIYQAVAEVTAM